MLETKKMSSIVIARRNQSYKEKSELARREADELVTALASSRRQALEAKEVGESLQSLGEIAERVTRDIVNDNDMDLPEFAVPAGGTSVNDRYDRFEKQFYNLMLAVANLTHEHSGLGKRYADLLAKSAESLSDLRGGEIYESRAKSYSEHLEAVNDAIETSAGEQQDAQHRRELALITTADARAAIAKRNVR
jgi:hypothetical protein